MHVHVDAHLLQVALVVRLAPQVNSWTHPLTNVSCVQKVTFPKIKTVKHVNSVVQALQEKAVMQEIHLVRRVIWVDFKAHLVSVKIVRQASTLMVKVRKVVPSVQSTRTCLILANRPKQIVRLATQIARLEI